MNEKKFVLIWQSHVSGSVYQLVLDNLSQLIGALSVCRDKNDIVISVIGLDPDIFPDKL